MAEKFKVGQAPWETGGSGEKANSAPAPAGAYKVGQAPWEQAESHSAQNAVSTPDKPSDPLGTGEAALQGFSQGATLGYMPEMQAGLDVGLQTVLPQSMGGKEGFDLPTKDEYDSSLKGFRGRNQRLADESPIAHMAGQIAGGVAMLPVGGEAAAVGKAGTALKIAKAAGTGGALGFLQNTENPEGDYLDFQKRFHNAGFGAALGGAAEGTAQVGGAALAKAGEKLKNSAIVKQIGANAGQIKTILKKGTMDKIGGFLGEEGMLGIGQKVEDVAEKTKGILSEDGPKIGQMYADAQEQAATAQNALGVNNSNTKISGPELADSIMEQVRKEVKNHPNRDQVMKEMENSMGPLRDMGDNANITDVHEFRKGLDENIDWTKANREKSAVQKAYTTARNAVADKTTDVIDNLDKVFGGGKLDELKALNQRYSTASTVNNIATQGAGREMARTLMGHGVVSGAGGSLAALGTWEGTHDPLKTAGAFIAGTVATTAARKLGVPTAYKTGQMMSALGKGAQVVGRNPVQVGAAANQAVSPWMNMQTKKDEK